MPGQGGRVRYWADYMRWQVQEVTDLKGGGGSGGGGVVDDQETDTEDQSRGDWKWSPRQDMDADGPKQQLITIGMEQNYSLAYAPGTEHHLPNISTLGGYKE